MSGTLACGACGEAVPPQDWNHEGGLPCVRCQTMVAAWVFPAAWTGSEGTPPVRLADGDGAACYFHPRNQAETPCVRCGRLVCRICAAGTVAGEICRECFGRAMAEREPAFVRQAVMHDGIGLAMATLPAATVFLPIFSAPLAFLYTLVTWRKTHSVVRRSGVRRWLALLVAVLSVGWMIAFLVWVAARVKV